MRFATKAIRVGQDPDGDFGAVINPIHQSATFAWRSLDQIPPHDYTRVSNPNRASLEAALASLENGSHCVAFSSGMAAIVACFSLMEHGDHMLMASDIYGGTQRVKDKLLPRSGIEATEFDGHSIEDLQRKIRPNTKLAIFETPTNPTLRIVDIQAITVVCRRAGIFSVIDNTFASPALQSPLDLGIDVSLHSTTKYISGHSDVIGGAAITNDARIFTHLFEYNKTVGAVPSPFDCWLTLRGLKTLGVRMKQHCANAGAVARFLERHPKVARVHFPGLASHPEHAIAKRQMSDFGGMVTFEVKGTPELARAVCESTRVFMLAESLGGVESLIGYPSLMSHACMTEEQRLAKGIPPTLIRLSVGIEDVDDLLEDLDQALRFSSSSHIRVSAGLRQASEPEKEVVLG